MIKFNQKALLKPHIDMNTDLRKAVKNDFEKDFFKLMNNSLFGKLWKIFKNTDITLEITETRRNYLVSEPNFYIRTFFTEHLLVAETKKLKYF